MKKIALPFLVAAIAQIGTPRLEAALTPKDLKPFEGHYRGVMEMSENGRKSTFPVTASLFRYAGGLTQFSVPATTNLKTAVYFDLRRNGSFKSFSLLPGFEYKVLAEGNARIGKGVLRISVQADFASTRSGQFEFYRSSNYTITARLSPNGKKLTLTHLFRLEGKNYIFRYRLQRSP